MSKSKTEHLSPEALELWRDLGGDTLKPDAQVIALTTAEAFDRMRAAQQELREAGGVAVVDRYGQYKQHPALSAEQHARSAILRGVAALRRMQKADGEAPPKPDESWRADLTQEELSYLADAEKKLGMRLYRRDCLPDGASEFADLRLHGEQSTILYDAEKRLGLDLMPYDPL